MFSPGSVGLGASCFTLFLVAAQPLHLGSPWSILWTAPLLLGASVMIAWAAESAQFFIAQGFALAILAWLQTLPEFAVEAVLAWHQQTPLLLSNLTGALRLLTGVGWPLIYVTAAIYNRAQGRGPLRRLRLERQDSVQVLSLFAILAWVFVIYFKRSLTLVDAVVLIALYGAYLLMLNRIPPAGHEDVEDLERVPHAIVTARPGVRNASIALLFLGGGALIYLIAEPFLGSVLGVATAAGISQFVAVQWIAPFVSEFPEKVSAFYWARSVERAPTALMNMVSSNVNQWTLLAAMLPIVLSLGAGAPREIFFDGEQSMEWLMTAAQSLLGVLLLLDMSLAGWEAILLFVLWGIQFGFSIAPAQEALRVHEAITAAYFIWCAVQGIRLALSKRLPEAFAAFRSVLAS